MSKYLMARHTEDGARVFLVPCNRARGNETQEILPEHQETFFFIVKVIDDWKRLSREIMDVSILEWKWKVCLPSSHP